MISFFFYCSLCLFVLFIQSTQSTLEINSTTSMGKSNSEQSNYAQSTWNYLRRLSGSNCILIERGVVTEYYDCVGCNVNRAFECVTDLRKNKSANVPTGCKISSEKLYTDSSCCPSFYVERTGVTNLKYLGAAYPMALQCIEAVGCKSSNIYKQLLLECSSMCPAIDPRNENSVCLSTFNSAPGRLFLNSITTTCVLVIITILSLYLSIF